MTSDRESAAPPAPPTEDGAILAVHLGPSANCSSIGSFIDFLFLSSVAGGAMVAVLAALAEARREPKDDADEEE